MKYIVLADLNGVEHSVVFSTKWQHTDVAHRMALPGQQVVSAGFVELDDGGRVICFGSSSSLGISSRPDQDGALIASSLIS